mmetsp:Transcript_29646/g.48434  ORF Transcript_29646/g.48434 Transcript_29646/m.48434 type:complete len:241 (-) Transcript_29646:20-742(-)
MGPVLLGGRDFVCLPLLACDSGPAFFFFVAGIFCCCLLLSLIGQSFFRCWSDPHFQQNRFSSVPPMAPHSACLCPSCKQYACSLLRVSALPSNVVLSALTVAFPAPPKRTPKVRLSFVISSCRPLISSSLKATISPIISRCSLIFSTLPRSSALAFFSCSSSMSSLSNNPGSKFPFPSPPFPRGYTTPVSPAFRHFVTGSPSPEHHPFPSTKAIGSTLTSSPTLAASEPTLHTILILVIG